ncbi:hypothetical protein ACFQ1I_45225 [Kitasatospora arboriphila]
MAYLLPLERVEDLPDAVFFAAVFLAAAFFAGAFLAAVFFAGADAFGPAAFLAAVLVALRDPSSVWRVRHPWRAPSSRGRTPSVLPPSWPRRATRRAFGWSGSLRRGLLGGRGRPPGRGLLRRLAFRRGLRRRLGPAGRPRGATSAAPRSTLLRRLFGLFLVLGFLGLFLVLGFLGFFLVLGLFGFFLVLGLLGLLFVLGFLGLLFVLGLFGFFLVLGLFGLLLRLADVERALVQGLGELADASVGRSDQCLLARLQQLPLDLLAQLRDLRNLAQLPEPLGGELLRIEAEPPSGDVRRDGEGEPPLLRASENVSAATAAPRATLVVLFMKSSLRLVSPFPIGHRVQGRTRRREGPYPRRERCTGLATTFPASGHTRCGRRA